MIITATQLKVQGIGGWFQFYSRIGNINRQLRSAEGLVFSKVKGLKTLTGWKSHEAMKAFRNSGEHLSAMKHLRKIGKAKSVTWESEEEPDWREVVKKLQTLDFS